MSLWCTLIGHKWGEMTQGPMLRSRGGILAGTCETGIQTCQRCGEQREAYLATGFMMMAGNVKPRAMTPKIRAVIESDYIPL